MAHCLNGSFSKRMSNNGKDTLRKNMNFSLMQKITLNNVQNRRVLVGTTYYTVYSEVCTTCMKKYEFSLEKPRKNL